LLAYTCMQPGSRSPLNYITRGEFNRHLEAVGKTYLRNDTGNPDEILYSGSELFENHTFTDAEKSELMNEVKDYARQRYEEPSDKRRIRAEKLVAQEEREYMTLLHKYAGKSEAIADYEEYIAEAQPYAQRYQDIHNEYMGLANRSLMKHLAEGYAGPLDPALRAEAEARENFAERIKARQAESKTAKSEVA